MDVWIRSLVSTCVGALFCLAVPGSAGAQMAVLNITSPAAVNEGDAGTTIVTFNIVCDPCDVVNAIVDWSTMDGTATTADGDYVARSGQIDDLGNGTTPEIYPIEVTINGDTAFEGDETFTLKITGASVGCPSLGGPGGCPTPPTAAEGTATILNDDDPNQPPTAEANGPYSVAEGGSVGLSSAGSMDPDGDPLTFEWDLDNDGSFETMGPNPIFSAALRDGPDSQTVVLRVSDGTASATDAATVSITNVAPSVVSISVDPEPSDEGEAVTVDAPFTDPGVPDTHTCTLDFGDGTPVVAGTVGAGSCSGSHTYVDDDPSGTASDTYTITVEVTDDDSGSDSDTAAHVVANVDPVVGAVSVDPAAPTEEGQAVAAEASFTDAGTADTHTCTVDYDEGDGAEAAGVVAGTCQGALHTYADDDTYTVTVEVTDDDTGTGVNDTSHQVDNVDPTITATTQSAADCGDTAEGDLVEVSADFSDPGFDNPMAGTVEDFDTSEIDWGDGTIEPADVTETPGGPGTATTGTASGSHVYATGGIFTITVTVRDDDGGEDSASFTALVTGAGLNGGEVQVVGTSFKDVVHLSEKGSGVEVMAGFLDPEKVSFPLVDVSSARVVVCDGDDQVHVDQKLAIPTVLEGGAGGDHLRAGDGVTVLQGGPGDDHLFGGRAMDFLDGESGSDHLFGGAGDDSLLGGGDDDHLFGQLGDDLLDGGPGVDVCKGGPGANVEANCEP